MVKRKIRELAVTKRFSKAFFIFIIISIFFIFTPHLYIGAGFTSNLLLAQERYKNSHFGIQGAIVNFPDEMKEAGIEITREWIVWSKIEPEDDVYDWTEMDKKVRQANDAGIEVLGYFIDMPIWARNMENPKCNRTLKNKPIDACEPKDWNDFKEFAKNVAERYDGKHGYGKMKYIEIFNEVQGFSEMNAREYEPWLINGYQAIKQGNPDVQVLLGAVHAPLDFNGGKAKVQKILLTQC